MSAYIEGQVARPYESPMHFVQGAPMTAVEAIDPE
jgi:hypothetical protein